ncbi:protein DETOXIFICATION [Trifolium repens]|nr:protein DETOXIFICATION [Trifolium repens]
MVKEEATPLLTKSEENDELEVSEGAFWAEFKRVGSMAAPMVTVTVSQYLLQVVSLMMVGHIGILASFSGVALAVSFAECSGFCVLIRMAGALETLCGQTYGAQEFSKIGNYTCSAMITLILVCFPISLMWIFMDKLLMLFGQDTEISHVAREYCICLIPALFGHAVLQSLIRYFQIQKCEKTKIVFSYNAILCITEFCQFAIPSGLMFCLEWWSFEILTIVAGLLPNSQLETSVLSVCLSTTTLHYFIPHAIGASASTRVSNELGAGNPRAAKGAVRVVVVIGIAEAVIVSTLFLCLRNVIGNAYSNDKEVVDYVTDMVPLLCVSVSADSIICALSGIARGGGFQTIGAYVNLGAYYIVGAPIALLLGFGLKLNAKGLWMGTLTGSILNVIILAVVTVLTDWQKEATKARERIAEKSIKAHDGSV